MSTYRNYFDIDPTYFPAVNADVIKRILIYGRSFILMKLLSN